jgi:hypothetical protein
MPFQFSLRSLLVAMACSAFVTVTCQQVIEYWQLRTQSSAIRQESLAALQQAKGVRSVNPELAVYLIDRIVVSVEDAPNIMEDDRTFILLVCRKERAQSAAILQEPILEHRSTDDQ